MPHPENNHHSRTQFQIDRVAFFSDAVIAIAITLMVLEIKIPEFGENATLKQILSTYGKSIIFHAIALMICFSTIGNLWIRHHELYEHIVKYNKRLIRVNLYFLLSIMLLPLSISFLFSKNNPEELKAIPFLMNLALCNLTYYFMLLVIFHRKNNFFAFPQDEHVARNKRNGLLSVILFSLVSFLMLIHVSWYYFPFIAWPFLRRILMRIDRWRRKKALARSPAAD